MTIDVSDSLFVRNQATGYISSGGAIRIKGTGMRCSITDSVVFALNTAEFDGGGIYVSDQATVTINGASFIANEALNGGGAALFVMVGSCHEHSPRLLDADWYLVIAAYLGVGDRHCCGQYSFLVQPCIVQRSWRRDHWCCWFWIKHDDP